MAIDFKAMMRQAERKLQQKQEKSSHSDLVLVNDIPTESLDTFKLSSFPNSVFYVENFVNDKEAASLVEFCESKGWTQLTHRRLKNFGGVPHPSGTILEPLPQILQKLGEKLKHFKVFPEEPDQALVNEYSVGGGIGFHKDGPNFKPRASIVSLLSSCVMHFRNKATGEERQLLLEPKSLLVFSDEAYNVWEHSIFREKVESFEDRNVERGKRFSITLRNVSSVKYRMSEEDEVLPTDLQEERIRRLDWWKSAISESTRE